MTPTQTHYRITRVVGEGAFGTVYEAERIGEGLSRRVAMKLLHATHTGHTPIENRLRDEARMLSLINHRAIVRVDDLIRVDNAWCVVMEFVAGADLRHLLDAGPVPARAALEIAEEVAGALHAAHSQLGPEGNPLRLVHRDIKPENIRVTNQGEVKLLDFGIARADFNAREAATQQGGLGTLVYMSAERYRGDDTHAGDVYALGVTLFELLTGVPPGSSAADSDRHPPGRKLRPQWEWLGELDPALLECITAMVAPEAEDRPTARECARRLAEMRSHLTGETLEDWAERTLPQASGPSPVLQRRPSVDAPRANTTLLSVGQMVGTPRHTPTQDSRAPWAALGLGAVVAGAIALGVAGIIGWWGWKSLDPGVSPPANAATTGPAVTPAIANTPPDTPPVAAASHGAAAPNPPAGGTALPTATVTRSGATGAPPDSAKTSRTTSTTTRTTSTTVPVPAIVPPTPTAPIAEAPPTKGTLSISGADSVVIDGPDRSSRPGSLIPGKYSAQVTFSDGTTITVNGIRVEAGRATRVRCDETFSTCGIGSPE